jgi:hypothetical protein
MKNSLICYRVLWKVLNTNQLKKKKSNIWKYIFIEVGTHSHINVCKTFICDVLKISFGRIREIDGKIVHKKSFFDMRVKHKAFRYCLKNF